MTAPIIMTKLNQGLGDELLNQYAKFKLSVTLCMGRRPSGFPLVSRFYRFGSKRWIFKTVEHTYSFANKSELNKFFDNNKLLKQTNIEHLGITPISVSTEGKEALGEALIKLLNSNLNIKRINLTNIDKLISQKHKLEINNLKKRNSKVIIAYAQGRAIAGSGILIGLVSFFATIRHMFPIWITGLAVAISSGLVGVGTWLYQKTYVNQLVEIIKKHSKVDVDVKSIKTMEVEKVKSIKAGLNSARTWSGWVNSITDCSTWKWPLSYYRAKYFVKDQENLKEIEKEIDNRLKPKI